MKPFLGNFYRHLAIFSGHTDPGLATLLHENNFVGGVKIGKTVQQFRKFFQLFFSQRKVHYTGLQFRESCISRILHFANAIRHCIALRWHSLLRFLLLFNYASGDNYYWKHFLIYLLLNKTFAKKWMDSNTFYWCWKTVWWRHPIGHLITAIRVEVGLKTLATAVPTTI